MKLAKRVISLGAACSFLLQASIVYAATIGPRIEQPFNRRLFRAIANNDITTVQQMLAQGQIALHGNLELGRTPLHFAAIKGHADIILLLLRAGTHIDVKPDNGDTALHEVALRGHTNTIQLLLDEGANPNAESHRGMTPLSKAVSNGHADAARLLVRAGAKVTDQIRQILHRKRTIEAQGLLVELLEIAASRDFGEQFSANQDELFSANQIKEKEAQIEREEAQIEREEAQIEREKAQIEREKAQIERERRALLVERLHVLRSMTEEELRSEQKQLKALSLGGDAALWHMLPERLRGRLSILAKSRADFIADAPTTAQRYIREQEMQQLEREKFKIMEAPIQQVMRERGIRPSE